MIREKRVSLLGEEKKLLERLQRLNQKYSSEEREGSIDIDEAYYEVEIELERIYLQLRDEYSDAEYVDQKTKRRES